MRTNPVSEEQSLARGFVMEHNDRVRVVSLCTLAPLVSFFKLQPMARR